MTEKSRDIFKYLLGGASVLLLAIATLLYNSQYDFIKSVEARVCKVEDNKADKEAVREIKQILIRMEDKIDRISGLKGTGP